jgi:short-subunit dehydrogenase
MVSKGAKNLVLLSRHGAKSPEQLQFLDRLRQSFCRIKVCECDIANHNQLEAAMKECQDEMPPIRGCIQGSMVLEVRHSTRTTAKLTVADEFRIPCLPT